MFKIVDDFNFSWQKDPLCEGTPYPKVFHEFKKTLGNFRKLKYGKAPTNGIEVLTEFEKEAVLQDYGFSLLQEHGPIFNGVVVRDNFENCIFSSAKSIDLILENTTESERFFIVDGTFRITPKGVWKQVLILHINFGFKVSKFTMKYFVKEKHYEISLLVFILVFSIGNHPHVKTNH